MSNFIINATEETFEDEIKNTDKTVVVDFWAEWCGPCKMVAPHLESLAEEREADFKVIKVNVDQARELATRFQVRSIPTLMIFKGGLKVETKVGAMGKGDLDKWIAPYAS